MPIQPEDLTKIDYDILNYVNKHNTVTLAQLTNHFSSKIDAIEYRLKKLLEYEYHNLSHGLSLPVNNSSYIVEEYEENTGESGVTSFTGKNIFYLSPLGKKVLQDYKTIEYGKKKVKIRENIRYAITTTIALGALAVAIIALLK